MKWWGWAGLFASLLMVGACTHTQPTRAPTPQPAQEPAPPAPQTSAPSATITPPATNPSAPAQGSNGPSTAAKGQGPRPEGSSTTKIKPVTPHATGTASGTNSPGATRAPGATPAPGTTTAPGATTASGTSAATSTNMHPSDKTPTLDLAALEKRLRDTSAIGVFTKLSLKNQVDDLLKQFRGFHSKQSAAPLTDLRQRYDSLLNRVLSLLQSGDPDLARAIDTSREAIWGILIDPQKFAGI
jgi:hypothetical protein